MSGCSVDFPIYDITSVDSVRVALCGGGGVVKSGVPNAVVSFFYQGKDREDILALLLFPFQTFYVIRIA
jgi:ABC-type spermidine/putrescine transport system permease subunit I